MLGIHADSGSDLIRWELTLSGEGKAGNYKLRCEHERATGPGQPEKATAVVHKEGTWTASKGTESNPDATVLDLKGAVALVQIDPNILHLLNSDRTLMLGHGGWSYTLNRKERAEKSPDPTLVQSQPDMSYKISPLASGPNVFGVFEGRSPCQAMARDLKLAVHPGCAKVKWRVTLFQDPATKSPTTYKIEGSLYRQAAREGSWRIVRGTQADSHAIVYHLAGTESQPAVLLLKGDDNVLFFLDENLKPRVGHADFSYTLNRRTAP